MKIRGWSQEEINVLKDYYKNNTKIKKEDLMSLLPGRNKNQIGHCAKKLGLTTRWTKEQVDFLETNYESVALSELSENLGKSVDSIDVKLRRMGLKDRIERKFIPVDGEEWVDISGYKELYKVSNLGRVRSKKNDWGLMSENDNGKGYKMVNLTKEKKRKQHYIHRLVYLNFGGKVSKEVNHIDGDKSNNKLSNLEGVTRKENVKHALDTNLVKQKKLYAYHIESKKTLNLGNFRKAIDQGWNPSALRKSLDSPYRSCNGYMIARSIDEAKEKVEKYIERREEVRKKRSLRATQRNKTRGHL